MPLDLRGRSAGELLTISAAVGQELRDRGITRSSNNPVGDLAEFMFCRAFGWEQAPNSTRDVDATDTAGTRYQIKGRKVTEYNPSRQLSALRDLESPKFDVLAAILFNADYTVFKAALIPHSLVLELAKRVERTNSWRFILRDSVFELSGVQDVTPKLTSLSDLES